MALTKVTYVENTTVIHAQNLNDIQDEIIANGNNITDITDDVTALSDDVTEALTEKADVIVTDASGSIASFSDGADGKAVQTVFTMNPVQSGSGDPSPSNVRPISGHTSIVVYRTGANLWDEDWEAYDQSQIRSKTRFRVKGGETYYLKSPVTCSLYFSDENGTSVGATNVTANTTFTAPSDAVQVRLYTVTGYGTTYNHDISINYPSTDHDYHAYTGTSVTYSLGSTVYGGTLTINEDGTGTLTVTDANIASYSGQTLPSTWISDRDVYSSGSTPTTGAQVVYKLATPTTTTLTAQEVLTLLNGSNNVWHDANGNTSITYRADTKLYIDNKIATAIASL